MREKKSRGTDRLGELLIQQLHFFQGVWWTNSVESQAKKEILKKREANEDYDEVQIRNSAISSATKRSKHGKGFYKRHKMYSGQQNYHSKS